MDGSRGGGPPVDQRARMPARCGRIPSAGVHGDGCWTPPPFFGEEVGPTTTPVFSCVMYIHTVSKLRECSISLIMIRAARFVKSRYAGYSCASDMLDDIQCVGMAASFSKETGGSTYSVLPNY